jgi:AAA domain/UvrD-like helicase C-terminal domain
MEPYSDLDSDLDSDSVETSSDVSLLQIDQEEFDRFNEEQKRGFLDLRDFVGSIHSEKKTRFKYERPGGRYAMLDGPGGCGKTYLVSKLLRSVKKLRGFSVGVLAPTHKASNVIRLAMKGTTVMTIAKFLGYTVSINPETGNEEESYIGISKPAPDLLIIDECSMVSSKQVSLLKKSKIPIIFIGDICQINPVNEACSDVFKFDFEKKITLVKNERVTNQKVREIINYTRQKTLEKKIPSFNETDSTLHFTQKAIGSFRLGHEAVVLAHKNATVKRYNDIIRSALYAHGSSLEKYYSGETLVSSKYFKIESTRFYTSDKVLIETCERRQVRVKNPICTCDGIFKKLLRDSDLDSSEKCKLDIIDTSDEDTGRIPRCQGCGCPPSTNKYSEIEMYVLTVYKAADPTNKVNIYDPVNDTEHKRLESVLLKYRDACKHRKDSVYWKHYYSLRDRAICKLIYCYAMTIHKSQGSGFDNVFFDLSDLVMHRQDEYLRLIYTAVSRTKERLVICRK